MNFATLGADRLVTYQEATEFLGYSPSMLEYAEKMGRLEPAVTLDQNGERMYRMGDLRAYNKRWRNPPGLTLQDIVGRYNVTQFQARFSMTGKRNVEPVGVRGQTFVWTEEDVEMVAALDGWERRKTETATPLLEHPLPPEKVGPVR